VPNDLPLPLSFSDTVAGYVREHRGSRIVLQTPEAGEVTVHLTGTTTAQLLRNLGEPYRDATGRIGELLTPGTLVFTYGPVYASGTGRHFQVDRLLIVGEGDRPFPYETPGWWVDQLDRLAAFYRRSQFGDGPVDMTQYRTHIRSTGHKSTEDIQETDTLSRMVYGMASAYMLTGKEDYLEVAERGSQYLHDNMRFRDEAEDIVYWYHGMDVTGTRQRKLFASEFGDDYRAIPAYEQIYALVGLTQTYRLTGDPAIKKDIEDTVSLFERFFRDSRLGGYFSHIDPVTLSPHHDGLGPNHSRKNWNSVGDHAPAYLINMYLATGEERYRQMLEHTFDMIATYMPDRRPGGSPFVNERFYADWTPDHSWGWQQNRAVIGHNLKIAWNLTRMGAAVPKREYRQLAAEIAATMPSLGRDVQRGGWYDLVEREPEDGRYAFVWHDRKTWWQQEQAILAYLVLAGHTGNQEYLRHAREASAFYNAFFLDHDEGGVHFTVLAQGLPFVMGNERLKGSHAMAMYHKSELCYLAEVYTQLLVNRGSLDLWFSPRPDADFPDGLLRVAPDILPYGKVVIDSVRLDGAPHDAFDAQAMTVKLPSSHERLTVRVRLRHTGD
jgi:mannose/cellobiose epimerase-like protein (N-acyl-D-glucosamine 2-epimerase family)